MPRSTPDARWIRQIDVLRAVGCVMVMAMHVVWMTADIAVPPAERLWWYAWSQFLEIGCPLFFFASALLCFHKYREGVPLQSFYRKRLLYLGVPYAIWTVVYLLIEVAVQRPATYGEAARLLGISLVFGVRHLQFVSALFQFYLLFPLFRLLWNRAERWPLVVSAFLISIAWTDASMRYMPEELMRLGYSPHGGVVLAWLPFIALGAWASEHLDRLDDLVPQPRWMYTTSAFLLTASAILSYGRAVDGSALAGQYAGAARPAVLIASALWLPFFLRLAWNSTRGPAASLLRELGRHSAAIYFVHPLALLAVSWMVAGHTGPWLALALLAAAAVFGTGLMVNHMMRAPAGILVCGMGRRCERMRPLSERRFALAAPEAPTERDFLDLQQRRTGSG